MPDAEEQAGDPGGAPPLVVDREAPLLLEEPAGAGPVSSGTTQALPVNGACLVCHANFKEEPIVGRHAEGKIGCVDCHGASYAHRNDESNSTPPDVMYAAERINPSCRKCHAAHDVPAEMVVGLWLERHPTGTHAEIVACTDCHGAHRLTIRSVRWDKDTGKLVRKGGTGGEGHRGKTPPAMTGELRPHGER